MLAAWGDNVTAMPKRETVESSPAPQTPVPPVPEPLPESTVVYQSPVHTEPASRYTRVPNELLDALLPTLEPYEQLVLLRLYRLTAGFHRPACVVSFATLGKACKLSERTVIRQVQSLVDKGLVVRRQVIDGPRAQRGNEYTLRLDLARTGDQQTPVRRTPARGTGVHGAGMKEKSERKSETAPVAAAPALDVYGVRRIAARIKEASPEMTRDELRRAVRHALIGDGREVDERLLSDAIG